MIVALDGFAGVGKSSTAAAVAEKLGFKCMDTGAMFRAVAYKLISEGGSLDDADAAGEVARLLVLGFEYEPGEVHPARIFLDGKDVTSAIRRPDISDGASRVSVWPEVRAAVLDMERKNASSGDFVVEGRDIGTVVFPCAELKIFLTASPKTRAERRLAQYAAQGIPDAAIPLEEMERLIAERDERDSTRGTAPCAPASDAVVLETDEMSFNEVVERICALARERRV